MEKQEIIQYDNGYISKTPIFQFPEMQGQVGCREGAGHGRDALVPREE